MAASSESHFAAAPAGLTARLMLGLIRLYQLTLSPWMGRGCRYFPTCSAYASEAVALHGALAGGWLAARRIARCNPWGGHGVDAVPEPVVRARHTCASSSPSVARGETLSNTEART